MPQRLARLHIGMMIITSPVTSTTTRYYYYYYYYYYYILLLYTTTIYYYYYYYPLRTGRLSGYEVIVSSSSICDAMRHYGSMDTNQPARMR